MARQLLIATAAAVAAADSVYMCAPPGWSQVTRFQDTFVCVTLGAQMAVFRVTADVFTAVQIFGAFNAYASSSSEDVTFTVASMGANSADTTYASAALKLYAYTDGGERRFIPSYTAMIHANNGVVDSIEFDEGCFFCGSLAANCVADGLPVDALHPVPAYQQNCYMAESDCAASTVNDSSTSVNTCDLKLFLAWSGTDRNGNFFTSTGQRFSRYLSFSLQLGNLWSTVLRTGSDLAARLNPTRITPG